MSTKFSRLFTLAVVALSLLLQPSAFAIINTDMDGDGDTDQTDLDLIVANIEGLSQENFNADNFVDGDDLSIFKVAFGVTSDADTNGNSLSNGYDGLAWQRHFNEIRTVRGDADGDGTVCDGAIDTVCTTLGIDDRPIWQANLGQTGFGNPADFDDDGDVDLDDEAIMSGNHFMFLISGLIFDADGNGEFGQSDIDLVANAVGVPSPTPQFFPSADSAIASEVALSLNLVFNTSGDPSSGGTWTVVGRAELAGLAAVSLALSDVEFNDITGFLGPASFEVGESADFGTHQDIVLMDDMENVVNDVGVVGTFVSTYVDDPALVPLGGQPDLGSFTGGVELATGAFPPGSIPDWFDNGSTSTLSNLFTGGTITFNRITGGAPEVNLATTLLTVRSTNIPEPATLVLLCMGLAGTIRRSRLIRSSF